jgi:hypothetical protein
MSLTSTILSAEVTTNRRLTRLGKPGNRVKFLSPLTKFFQSPRLHFNVVIGRLKCWSKESTDPVLPMSCSFPVAISRLQHQFQFEKAGIITSMASRRLEGQQAFRRFTKTCTAICLHSAYTAVGKTVRFHSTENNNQHYQWEKWRARKD